MSDAPGGGGGRRIRIVRLQTALALALVVSLPLSGCLVGRLFFPPPPMGAEALEDNHVVLGAWLGKWPTDSRPLIDRFEDKTGTKLDIVDVFLDWWTPVKNVTHTLEHVARHGSVPMLTWEPHSLTTRDILAGTEPLRLRDGRTLSVADYLDEFAKGVCRVAVREENPVLIRALHEMNGNWNPWNIGWVSPDGDRPNTDESFRAAWRRVHEAFAAHCTPGKDVLFLWAVNHFSVGDGTSFEGTYPGDDLVDYVGVDGYNWGTNANWGWQDFDTIFKAPYCAVARVSSKPVIVAEWGSTERGGDKADWIRDSFGAILERYPRIRGMVWLNEQKYEGEIQGRMDWPVDSSAASLDAYREAGRLVQSVRTNETQAPGPPGTEAGPACVGSRSG